MSETRGTSRRRFLQAALGAGFAVALVPLRPWRALIEFTTPPLGLRLIELLEHRGSARVVGREYLRGTSGEASPRDLVDAIASDLPGGREAASAASRPELQQMLAARVRKDFADELTVNLRGWIVSRTEARLCALAALQGPMAPRSTPRRV
jgi:hypothetical protein